MRNYLNYLEGAELGDSMPVWRVQTVRFGEPWIDPGMISSPDGFEDSPDAEFIMSGLNSKGPTAVAVGRQANLLMWGFYAPPHLLTDEGQLVFINAIAYISRFDGCRPLVSRIASSREGLANQVHFYSMLGPRAETMFRRTFTDDIVDSLGSDRDSYNALLRDNLEFMHQIDKTIRHDDAVYEVRVFAIDPDVKQLGISNRDQRILDACISMLERGDRPELARRVLDRYTDLNLNTPQAWRDWIDEHRDRLFFSDVGGYRWFIAPKN